MFYFIVITYVLEHMEIRLINCRKDGMVPIFYKIITNNYC